jgi:tRNA threonylcarbamoyladenosine modification (KEOPS) complex  Pcc1 subunit
MAALRAALNMYLRLVNVADEVQGLVKVERRIGED